MSAIREAVLPLKAEAVERAASKAKEFIADYKELMNAVGWNILKIADGDRHDPECPEMNYIQVRT